MRFFLIWFLVTLELFDLHRIQWLLQISLISPLLVSLEIYLDGILRRRHLLMKVEF